MDTELELLTEKWDGILQSIRRENDLSKVAFETWLLPLKIFRIEDHVLKITAPFEQAVTYVENKYKIFLYVAVAEAMGEEYEIEIITEDEASKEKAYIPQPKKIPAPVPMDDKKTNLNPKYTFDTFIVGEGNRHAHATCLAVADLPGQDNFNPLFLYGNSGLGKTHLMQSIAHYILQKDDKTKVLYVPSETFTHEIIDAIKNHTTNEFREEYRNVDVLLIDDIQFIIKKESTQTEFFNTFNELYNNKKQIILSSDQPPKELQSLNERIRSRFECGIPIDIHEPDYETRMAILKTKAEMDHLNDIPEEVFQYIAENVTNNIRELEGALHKIGIFSKLMKEEVTLETAKESLKDLINKEKNETITGETILKTVSEHMNISPDDIRSKKRSQDIATARQVVMYLCRKLTVMSLQSAGNIVGGRDHTTVINGINRVEAKRKEDPAFNNTIETIIKKLDTNA